MQQIYPDLWQTRPEQPHPRYPDLVTGAYLITRGDGNILLYSSGHEDEYARIAALGGVDRQYLSHVDEAGPALSVVRARFGAKLCAPAREAAAIEKASGVRPDILLGAPESHANGIEIVPAPGHTVGSTCFRYRSPHGKTYLFTGDTIGRGRDGTWQAGYIDGISDRRRLVDTLRMLADVAADVVISSAWAARFPVNEVTPAAWRAAVDEALKPLLAEA